VVWCKLLSPTTALAASNISPASGMTSRCGWRTLRVPIQIRASPCSIHGTAMALTSMRHSFCIVDNPAVEVLPCALMEDASGLAHTSAITCRDHAFTCGTTISTAMDAIRATSLFAVIRDSLFARPRENERRSGTGVHWRGSQLRKRVADCHQPPPPVDQEISQLAVPNVLTPYPTTPMTLAPLPHKRTKTKPRLEWRPEPEPDVPAC
jgi:hypothetical protein